MFEIEHSGLFIVQRPYSVRWDASRLLPVLVALAAKDGRGGGKAGTLPVLLLWC